MENKIVEPAAERKHHFFKIFHEEEHKRRLRIPVAFCSRLPTDSPACEWAIILGPSGASWIVEVNITENGTFLEDGWETFVQENGLKKYDFLVFRHDGGMQFHVKVFKGNGCPREECFAPALSPILAKESHDPQEECITPVPSPIPAQESHGPREECITPVPSPFGRERKRYASPCGNSMLKKRGSSSQEMLASAATAVGRKVPSFRSSFPFFWTCVNHFNVYAEYVRMTIPVKFARKHFPAKVNGEGKIEVLLQNEERQTWELGVITTPNQYLFSKGWKMFATDNDLKIGDFVIFELIGRLPDAKFVMNFHIYQISVIFEDDSDEE
ncbi:hypothetical protein MKW92_011897 [Papaver armeniacum]|nr:hypothetical protein MKW92_011897 [Papaver armeniacum]